MKYKNIYSAIHNFGDSFVSLTNYVDEGYVIDDLSAIHKRGMDIEIDWLAKSFEPSALATSRIKKSLEHFANDLTRFLQAQNVDLSSLTSLRLQWPAGKAISMVAVDDRQKQYRTFVQALK
ncbi:MAG: hypothetical protein ACM35H_12335 [Bacteroidota bacterium]